MICSREWISPAAVLFTVNRLVRRSKSDKPFLLTEKLDWYIMPMLNPDGYAYSRNTDRMWRKNR